MTKQDKIALPKAQDNNTKPNIGGSYREKFGLSLPSAGTHVKVKFMAGVNHYIVWVDCPDDENILFGWLKSKAEALKIVETKGWVLCK